MALYKNILITGASGDIGSALALAYATEGVTLALTGRNGDRLKSIADDCQQRGAAVVIEPVDVTDFDRLDRWIVDFDHIYPVDLVIANAGITSSVSAQGKTESWEQTKRVLDTNLYGTLSTVFPLLKPMLSRGYGQIGLMSSLSGYRGLPITPAYCASKAAVKVYGEALRGLVAASGVGVSVICPGFVNTSMSDRFPGPRPFMISPERAAITIKKGLEKNRARISFPFPLTLGTWLLSAMPPALADRFVSIFGYDRTMRIGD